MLRIVPENFPFEVARSNQIAAAVGEPRGEPEVGEPLVGEPDKSDVGEPRGEPKVGEPLVGEPGVAIPVRPKKPPFEPKEENIPQLQEWFLKEFQDTVFNVNADYLPVMKGTPHKIHLKEDAVPYAAHTPIPIPHHWKEEVKNNLTKMINLEYSERRQWVKAASGA